jgi:GNAT superfamily N-acetyltransferase
VDIELRADREIAPDVRAEIHEVLAECFPGYPDRSYFKQLPHFRYLGRRDGELVAHMAVEHRMINNGGSPLEIFGVVDLCVVASARSQGLAGRLIAELEALARDGGIDAVVLFADDPRLYLTHGYSRVPGPVKWLMINNHETLGVAEDVIDELMVKMLKGKSWNPGVVDMLGYVF